MKLISTLFLCFATSLPAFAAINITCHSTEEVEKVAEECEDNAKFTQAGTSCLGALEAVIKKEGISVDSQMKAANKTLAKGTNAQTSNFSGAKSNFNASMETLNALIAAAKGAKSNVGDYLTHIYYPEDFDAPEEVIGDPMEYLDSEHCYADNEKALKSIIDKIDGHIASLEAAKNTASSLKTTTGSDQTNLGAVGLPAVNSNGAAQTGSNPAAKAIKNNSSITGTVTDGKSKKVEEQEKK